MEGVLIAVLLIDHDACSAADACVIAQLCQGKLDAADAGPCVFYEIGLNTVYQELTCLGDTASDDKDFRIDDSGCCSQRVTQIIAELIKDLIRNLITSLCRVNNVT